MCLHCRFPNGFDLKQISKASSDPASFSGSVLFLPETTDEPDHCFGNFYTTIMQLKDGQRPTSDCMSHVKTKQPPCMNHQHASRQTTLCRNSHSNCLTFFTMGTQREATASRYVPSPCLGRSVDLLSMVCPSKPKPLTALRHPGPGLQATA